MTRRNDRSLVVVIAAMGCALLAAGYGLLALKQTTDSNAATIRQLVTVESEQQRLIQALQQQVRDLGGQPLTAPPPTVRTTPRTTAPPKGSASSSPSPRAPKRAPRPTRTPSPRATPSHAPSPQPTPSPTSTRVCPLQGICLPPGGH